MILHDVTVVENVTLLELIINDWIWHYHGSISCVGGGLNTFVMLFGAHSDAVHLVDILLLPLVLTVLLDVVDESLLAHHQSVKIVSLV